MNKEEQAVVVALAAVLKLLEGYQQVCERLLDRDSRYVVVKDRERMEKLVQQSRSIFAALEAKRAEQEKEKGDGTRK